jgi:hypothetical protein
LRDLDFYSFVPASPLADVLMPRRCLAPNPAAAFLKIVAFRGVPAWTLLLDELGDLCAYFLGLLEVDQPDVYSRAAPDHSLAFVRGRAPHWFFIHFRPAPDIAGTDPAVADSPPAPLPPGRTHFFCSSFFL